jgi:hypothetical protein
MQNENQYHFPSNKRKMLNTKMDIRKKNLIEVILFGYLLSGHGIMFSLLTTLLSMFYLGKFYYLLSTKYVEII